jgi:chemotaxis signal transduction protein
MREQIHLSPEPLVHRLPTAPACCCHLLFWNGRVVPVVDIAIALDGSGAHSARKLVGIYAFQHGAAAPEFGGLWLAAPPRQVKVDDSMACPLPASWHLEEESALSCFALDGQPIPILDLEALFSGTLLRLSAARPTLGKDAPPAQVESTQVRTTE